jgi:hypothetical protein
VDERHGGWEGKEPACSGSMVPSLNVGQDNCGCRLGQQPQSVPKITHAKAVCARVKRVVIRAAKDELLRSRRRIARLRALCCGQNAQADQYQRANSDPLSLDVE